MKEMLKYGFILGVICFLATAVLSIVNAVTEPQIKIQAQKEEQRALTDVFPEAADFKPVTINGEQAYYKAFDQAGKVIGFVVKSSERGYASDIITLTGLNRDLAIVAVKVISQNETPGLGSRVTTPEFQKQFAGKRLEDFSQVQAITGATISSSAVMRSIKNKMAALKEVLLKDLQNE